MAGFVVCVPTVWLGLTLSEAVPIQAAAETGLTLGTPALMALLTALAQEMIHGPLQAPRRWPCTRSQPRDGSGSSRPASTSCPQATSTVDGSPGRSGEKPSGQSSAGRQPSPSPCGATTKPVWRVWTILMTGLTIIAQMDRQPAIARTPLDRTRAWTAAALALIMMMSFTARP